MTDSATAMALQSLEELAATAEIHAKERHRIRLQSGYWNRVDDILNRERETGDPNESGALSLCYGAWIGQTLVNEWGASWVGLNGSVPPHLRWNGMTCSPVNAVLQRLQSSSAPRIADLVERLHSCQPAALAFDPGVSQAAWGKLSNERQFVSRDPLAEIPSDDLSWRDPWLASVDLKGRRVLCLAAGGGRHAPLYARAGAIVTVVDFSPEMLAIDEAVARKHGLKIHAVCTAMDELGMFSDSQFDLVIQPVSTCYVPDLFKLHAELARVIAPGGLYLVQHKSPGSLQLGEWLPDQEGYLIRTRGEESTPLPPVHDRHSVHRERGVMEFVHSLQTLLGGICRAGFHIEDVDEPIYADIWSSPGSMGHRSTFFPPYLKILARRKPS